MNAEMENMKLVDLPLVWLRVRSYLATIQARYESFLVTGVEVTV